MAWGFDKQIHALTGFDADSASNTEVGETFRTMTAQWLKDAAKEVINILPPGLLKQCTTIVSFTSQAVGSEASASQMNTGKILSVFAGDYEARPIPSNKKHKANDSTSYEYATTTAPVYYMEKNYLNVLPAAVSCKYEEVQFPTISFDDTAISSFPDEAEQLVVLRASMTALEYLLAIEEDVELYGSVLGAITNEYMRGVKALKTGNLENSPQQQKQ